MLKRGRHLRLPRRRRDSARPACRWPTAAAEGRSEPPPVHCLRTDRPYLIVVEPSVAVVVADDFPCAALAVTGAVAATALVKAAAFAGVALACVVGAITGLAAVALAVAELAVFAIPVSVRGPAAAVVVAVAAASVAAVFESVLVGVDEATCAETAWVLAAMAAAAIASGAVELPDVVAAGTFVAGVVTGIATATGFGVVAVRAACCARMVRSVADVLHWPACRPRSTSLDPVLDAPGVCVGGWVGPPTFGFCRWG